MTIIRVLFVVGIVVGGYLTLWLFLKAFGTFMGFPQ